MPDNDDQIISAASEIQRARGRLVDLTSRRAELSTELVSLDALIAQEQRALAMARAQVGKVITDAAR